MRTWREHLYALNRAGFDVLASEDIFRVLEQMASGRGMRLLTARGEQFGGTAAGGRLMAGMTAREIPLLLLGYSRGSMTTGWAMTKNFAEGCTYDLPKVTCSPPKGYTNIKGAILYASFVSGAGYLPEARDLADRNLFLGGMAAENFVAFYLGCPGQHEALARGLLRQRLVGSCGVSGGHDRGVRPSSRPEGDRSGSRTALETWPKEESDRVGSRMVAFAVAAIQGRKTLPDAPAWTDVKGLAATTPNVWELSSRPR